MENSRSQLKGSEEEGLIPIPEGEVSHRAHSTNGGYGDGGHVNKFLLCTLVCGMAREIKARAAQSGQTLPLLKIVRDVLRSHMEERPAESELSADGQLLNEEALRNEIERRLQEYLQQSREYRAEARRLDLESITAAVAAKHNRGTVKRGWLMNVG